MNSTYPFSNQKTDFSGSVYQKVNDSLQSGVSFGWSSKSNETQLAVGCVYKIDDSSSWKVIQVFLSPLHHSQLFSFSLK